MCDISDDSEPFEFSCETKRKARKIHKCDCCRGPIAIKEVYLSHVSKFEGEMCCEKMCAACLADRDIFEKEHGFFTSPSNTPDTYQDCVDSRDDFKSMLKWRRALKRIKQRRKAA